MRRNSGSEEQQLKSHTIGYKARNPASESINFHDLAPSLLSPPRKGIHGQEVGQRTPEDRSEARVERK